MRSVTLGCIDLVGACQFHRANEPDVRQRGDRPDPVKRNTRADGVKKRMGVDHDAADVLDRAEDLSRDGGLDVHKHCAVRIDHDIRT